MKNEIILREFMQSVWNEKNFDDIEKYLAPEYTIYIDNADPWEGKTINHTEFGTRLNYTFSSFPDVHFDIKTAVSDQNLVAITWIMTGTNTGNIGEMPATNKKIAVNGVTIYHFVDGKICGHTQVFDRTTVMKQLGFIK
ncbi:MAG: ester cyclase [Sediminibacterium sp.]|nr:ester cyclase [Sediminibacterium sp.]